VAKNPSETVKALLGNAPAPPPRAPRVEVVEPQPPAEPSQEQAVEPAPAASARPARPRKAPEPVPTPTPAGQQITQTRIPAHLFEQVRAAKDATGDTHETWFLDALDAVWDDLGDVYQPRPERRTRVPQRQRRTRRPTGDPLVSYPLRLTNEEVAVLRERMAELSPPSLADFVTTVVRLRLEQLGA